jgi:hypothetical protein
VLFKDFSNLDWPLGEAERGRKRRCGEGAEKGRKRQKKIGTFKHKKSL